MKTAVDVHNYLLGRETPHEMVPTGGRIRSPERLPAVLGLEPAQVARVVLVEAAGTVAAAIVPAERMPDPVCVAAALGEEATELSAARTTDLTGFLAESLPPVALPAEVVVLLDQPLMEQEVIYLPGGEPTSVLKIRPEDLLAATGARVLRLTA